MLKSRSSWLLPMTRTIEYVTTVPAVSYFKVQLLVWNNIWTQGKFFREEAELFCETLNATWIRKIDFPQWGSAVVHA